MAEIFDVFLSYNHDDKEAVRELAEALRVRGVRIWRDGDNLPLGQPWQRVVEEVIPSAPAAVAVIGPSGIGNWHRREIEACNTQNVKRGMPLIPLLLAGAPDLSNLPPFLSELHGFDLRDGLAKESLDELARRIPRAPSKTQPSPPVSGPRLHNLPFFSIGDLLKGRDEDLQNLAISLQGPSQATVITQRVIYGLGGIGKTRLAIEYAWRYGDRYKEGVFFVRAEPVAELRSGLAQLSGPTLLNLPVQPGQAENEVVGAVLGHLRDRSGWLLILDNVDTEQAANAVGEILPSLASGHVLITSRLKDWPAGIDNRPLQTLDLGEATAFLLQRTDNARTRRTEDPEQARRLADLLGGLPLALEQAAAYINRKQMTFAEYLDAWERERAQVLRWHHKRLMSYPESLATTWQKTFRQLDPTAASILRLAAYLAADPIPIDMFEVGKEIVAEAVRLLCEETGEEAVDGSISDAIADLAGYSMISRQGTMFTVHRMVQEVLRSRTPEERRRDWIEKALQIVDNVAPTEALDVRNWPIWDVLRPHVGQVIEFADQVGIPEPTGALMHNLAALLIAKALYREAEPLVRRVLELNETRLGPDHPIMAVCLNNLAQLFQDTNRLSEAEPLMRRALDIDEASLGKDHPNVARDLNNLASLLQATNRLSEAEPLMRRALDINEAFFGKDHPSVARNLNNLAQLLKATNRLSEAEPLMRRALDIDEASFGLDHPDAAIDLNNLALLLHATNRLAEAEPLMRQAVKVWEQSLGPDHPNSQKGRWNLEILLNQIADERDRPEANPDGAASEEPEA